MTTRTVTAIVDPPSTANPPASHAGPRGEKGDTGDVTPEAEAAQAAAELARDAVLNRAPLAKAANYTADAGDLIAADTGAGTWTLTLPAAGGIVTVFDAGGDWGTNALTVAGNGATIDGGASFSADVGGYVVTFIRAAGDAAWRYQAGYFYGA